MGAWQLEWSECDLNQYWKEVRLLWSFEEFRSYLLVSSPLEITRSDVKGGSAVHALAKTWNCTGSSSEEASGYELPQKV